MVMRCKTDTLLALILAELGIPVPTKNPQGQSVDNTTLNWEEEHKTKHKKEN